MLLQRSKLSEEEARVFAAGGMSHGSSNLRTQDNPAPPGFRQCFADLAYISLVTTGWFVGNILGILGCGIVFFIVLGGGKWDAFFLQVDNLASRYVAADLGRRGMFEHYLIQIFMVVLIVSTLLRAPAFVRRVRRELAQGPRK